MKRSNKIKLVLAGIWMICYISFQRAYLPAQPTRILVHLGDLSDRDDYTAAMKTWTPCLLFLNRHNIGCAIQVNAQTDRLDRDLEAWLGQLEGQGHLILRRFNTLHSGTMGGNGAPAHNLPSPHFEERFPVKFVSEKQELSLSLPTSLFRDEFSYTTRRKKFLIIWDDPSEWNHVQFEYFKENIEFLIGQGAKFVKPQLDPWILSSLEDGRDAR